MKLDKLLRYDATSPRVIEKVPELLQIALWAEATLLYAVTKARNEREDESEKVFVERLADVRQVLREMRTTN